MQNVVDSSLEYGNLDLFHEKGGGTQWFVLILDCGHIVGRYTNPLNEEAPKRVHCEYCEKNDKAIQRNFDFTSDTEGFERDSSSVLPKNTHRN